MDQGDNRSIHCAAGGACPVGLVCNVELTYCQYMVDAGPPQPDASTADAPPDAPDTPDAP
jgi:hypothetical protein